jgi:hypothetical protein
MTSDERAALEDLLEECGLVEMAVSAVLEDDAVPDDLRQCLQDLMDSARRSVGVIFGEEENGDA